MILERLKQFIDFKEIAVSAFEKSIGMSNASLAKSIKSGGTIGADKLENILIAYPDLNPIWITTGKGEMLIADQPENAVKEQPDESGMTEKLFALVEDQRAEIKMLLSMLREKDAKIEELRRELDARKGGTAPSVAGSSDAAAV